MGQMNLLKANWSGKVGQTVGAKWKNKSTIRTYTKPSNPNTDAQQTVRGVFSEMTTFVALFADQIRYKSALDTSGMSVRNAIIKANKDMIDAGTFTKANLIVSKGGLQKVNNEAASLAAGKVTVTWDNPTATNFTKDAKLIAILVQESSGLVEVLEADAKQTSSPTVSGDIVFDTTSGASDIDAYVYFLDKRGSNKVASLSDYISVAIA